jgi:hypothetical protein
MQALSFIEPDRHSTEVKKFPKAERRGTMRTDLLRFNGAVLTSASTPDRWFSSLLRQPVCKIACQFTHVCRVAESFQFVFCGFDVDTQALADLVLHLKYSRELLFRKHANLEVEVSAFFCLTGHAILTDENKDSEHNTFRGDDQS